MNNVYIYGRGLGLTYVKRCLIAGVTIKAYIDNFTNDKFDNDGISIIHKEDIDGDYDYIIISIIKFENIKRELIDNGITENKIICFFSITDVEVNPFYTILDPHKWKTELMWKYQKDVVIPTFENMFYENNAEKLVLQHKIPFIVDVEETIKILTSEHKSLARFGDGEFEMMVNRPRPRFQCVDEQLGKRLREIIKNELPNLLVAIANNYGDLSMYTDDAANGIRSYLTPSVRAEHFSYLDMHRQYYDAYLSRPYIMFRDKDKNGMNTKFSHIKGIWNGKKVLIIEGYHTRFGVGNDLVSNALDIIRILAPDKNAFSVYDKIFDSAKIYGKNRLILITLGPTATVLSYDLAKKGYWAIDIGQVDTEYEWFLKDVTDRCDVPYKTVSEYADKNIYSDLDERFKVVYEKQIVEIIEEK